VPGRPRHGPTGSVPPSRPTMVDPPQRTIDDRGGRNLSEAATQVGSRTTWSSRQAIQRARAGFRDSGLHAKASFPAPFLPGPHQGRLSFNGLRQADQNPVQRRRTRWAVIKMGYGVIIVGTGASGLCMAIMLRRAGRDDFIVLEKGSDLGGTWRENDYPGCASDVPAHLYSFSFAMNSAWTRRYASQLEIAKYLTYTARRFDLLRHIQFGTTVVSATFDDTEGRWIVETEDGARYDAAALVLAVGGVHRPAIPDITGLDNFVGPVFHSSSWDHDCDLDGKTVAVIGTGASSIQIVPAIAPRSGKLHVFQRTAPWVLPRRDSAYRSMTRKLFDEVSCAALLYRWYLYWRAEARVLAFRRYRWLMRIAHIMALRHLRRQVPDRNLRRILTPDYSVGCKQLLLSNAYYPALAQRNVELVATPIERVAGSSITTTDGTTRPVDAIVLATGFKPLASLDYIHVTGRHGVRLKEAWDSGAEAFLGVCISGFPNLFLMMGPNSGLAHTSLLFMIEAQARYITQAVNLIGPEARTVEVSPTVQRRFNSDLQRQLRRAVWSTGNCRSYYLDDIGVNRALWPNSTVSYWLRTHRISSRDFLVFERKLEPRNGWGADDEQPGS
jgi:cation diffusion facilitator CzcD-associated flavoprotein CzcO